MKRTHLPALIPVLILILILILMMPLRLCAVDPFYLDLLRDGIHAYDRGEPAAAARSLRLACFGMLDEPKALAACLARLALAQDKATDLAGFRETFTRLVEIEERFQGYSQADLPAELRTALEQKLAAHIPTPTLQGSPPVFKAAAKQAPPRPAASPPAKTPDRAPAQAIELRPTPPPAPLPQPPASPAPLTDEEKSKLEAVRRQLGETGKAKELRQAFQWAQEVADAHPEDMAAQRLAGEAAYRVSRWSDAAAYLQRGEGLPDSEPELLFYLAVSLYESGDAPGAAAALRRSLPNLQRSPYIDAYTRKILAQ
jgi:tetratricopeptide (TPR) repeat protein